MTKTSIFLFALLGACAVADAALADCLFCRCVYFSNPGWAAPIRTSGSFAAFNTQQCSATCLDIRIQCPFPGACYPVTGRYQVVGRVPEDMCPNPPPYVSSGRSGVGITIRRY